MKNQSKYLRSLFLVSGVLFLVFTACPVFSQVTGVCVNCHTMHNSQNNEVVSVDGPHESLLTNSCVGCHSSSSSDTIITLGATSIPIVFNQGSYPTQPLAGGNFHNVSLGGSANDVYGHNVSGISGPDNNLSLVPGIQMFGMTNLTLQDCFDCHAMMPGVDFVPFRKPRAGLVLICEDCHKSVRHHADDSATVADEDGGYYRFLLDVKGIEDSDWEQTVSASDHNEYQGAGANSMSRWGCGCHSYFHSMTDDAQVGSPWIRHPTDIVLPDSGEYSDYTTYNPEAPVARPDLSILGGPSDTVTPGTDMVMCLSCHRPHGSEYPDMLRWDYDTMVAGSGNSGGCFTCHSQKN